MSIKFFKHIETPIIAEASSGLFSESYHLRLATSHECLTARKILDLTGMTLDELNQLEPKGKLSKKSLDKPLEFSTLNDAEFVAGLLNKDGEAYEAEIDKIIDDKNYRRLEQEYNRIREFQKMTAKNN